MISMMVFLSVNGIKFNAPDYELANTMVYIADGKIDQVQVAKWVKFYSK